MNNVDMLRYILENKKRILSILASISLFVYILVKNSWVGDDAFISLRVIDNFVNGFGLVWNAGERVQAYTHPLWLLIMIPFYALLQDPYLSVYWLSLILSIILFILIIRYFANSELKILFLTLLLTLSMAFIDYSSSGLENPLTHLLLVLFLIVWLRNPISNRTLFFTSFIASLATFNRYDTILFYLPVILFQLYELRRQWKKSILIIISGFLPFILWECFSLFYYGFLFPNTYYAKLSAINLSTSWKVLHGFAYFKNSLLWDPITLTSIISGMIFVIFRSDNKRTPVVIGVFLYLMYVISIGGDFMSGRFFSGSLLMIAVLLISYEFPKKNSKGDLGKLSILFGGMVIVGLFAKYPPIFTKSSDSDFAVTQMGIANEKLFYFESCSWLNRASNKRLHEWAQQGMSQKELGNRVVYSDAVGLLGFYSGPEVYIIDGLTLTDPLRARLIPIEPFRIGHLPRVMPDGYWKTIEDHYVNHLENPELYNYYEKLGILIHDDLWSKQRLFEIFRMNIGKYDEWIDHYNESQIK